MNESKGQSLARREVTPTSQISTGSQNNAQTGSYTVVSSTDTFLGRSVAADGGVTLEMLVPYVQFPELYPSEIVQNSHTNLGICLSQYNL